MIHDVQAAIAEWSGKLVSADPSQVALGVEMLTCKLTELRDDLSPAMWEEMILTLRNSPLLPILLEDPCTRQSYHRPRGFSGDAGLIDFIYGLGHRHKALRGTSVLGRRIYAALQVRPLCRAVRFRKRLAAEFLRDLFRTAVRPSILVMAAGHLREVGPHLGHEIGPEAMILALDADQTALDCIARRLPGVKTRCRSVHDLVTDWPCDTVFDATYALGLYDSLTDAMAEKLLAKQIQLVRPGGRVLVCNFAPDAADRGYMEAFMDWKLVYRDEDEMQRLARRADPSCTTRVYREPSRQLVFLEMTKQG